MAVDSRGPAARSSQLGVTLIEALAAFVILSIGLLGIVSLQVVSKSSQHQAVQRTRAVALADGMLERIRSNPAGMATYDSGLAPLGGGTIADEPDPDCSAGGCTPAELALHDRWAWEQGLDGASVTVTEDGDTTSTAGLIEPRGCIVFEADAGKTNTGAVNVIVQWRGLEETSDAIRAGEQSCGGEEAGTDRTRRQVVVSSYVLDEREL